MTPQDLIWPSPASEMVWPSQNIEAVLSCNHLDNDVIDLTPGVDYTTSGGRNRKIGNSENSNSLEFEVESDM